MRSIGPFAIRITDAILHVCSEKRERVVVFTNEWHNWSASTDTVNDTQRRRQARVQNPAAVGWRGFQGSGDSSQNLKLFRWVPWVRQSCSVVSSRDETAVRDRLVTRRHNRNETAPHGCLVATWCTLWPFWPNIHWWARYRNGLSLCH